MHSRVTEYSSAGENDPGAYKLKTQAPGIQIRVLPAGL